MISGATRGTGRGGALARHLLKAENEVVVIPARGLGSTTLTEQLRELVAQSAGGRTDRPVYHVYCSPDPAIADNAAARARFWTLFETEFGMTGQPYCGVEHAKGGRLHEHRAYGLVRPSGAVVDLSWDYARREKCGRIVECEFGLAPVPSKHARTVAHSLRREGRSGVADWLVASGSTEAKRPVARLTPRERLIEERTGVALDDLRRLTLAAWRETADGPGFLTALRARGLELRLGRAGPVVVDASGTVHPVTRLVGAATRRVKGARIPAAEVRQRLAGLSLEGVGRGRPADHAAPYRDGGPAEGYPGGPGAPGIGGVGLRRHGGGAVRPDGGGGGHGRDGPGAALERLRAASGARRAVMRRHLFTFDVSQERYRGAAERARKASERLDDIAADRQRRGLALWGLTDIWGLPLR